MSKCIIPYIEACDQTAEVLSSLAQQFENDGADELLLCEYREDESIQEEFLMKVKAVVKTVDFPVNVGVHVKRFEDVKKAFYTGAKSVVICYEKLDNKQVIEESLKRFGSEQIVVSLDGDEDGISTLKTYGVKKYLVDGSKAANLIGKVAEDAEIFCKVAADNVQESFEQPYLSGIVMEANEVNSIMTMKLTLKSEGYDVNTFESNLDFSEFKLDSNGLIPAVVQDYKTGEVLMLGYMNEESFKMTIATGRMTYYSRSRQELWIKGETSGHYQYVKELKLDCDKDTILAKVKQIGAACHTGNRSCFYTELVSKQYDTVNPYSVFEDVYQVILDRKIHPKEGSYTNYLFDKGIDKILKKCGEEATEIVIAAKNPEVEELKYEISDFLYHCMVLMAERGVDWDDITKELAHRR